MRTPAKARRFLYEPLSGHQAASNCSRLAQSSVLSSARSSLSNSSSISAGLMISGGQIEITSPEMSARSALRASA